MIRQHVQERYKQALKAKDQTRVSTLRLIQAALKDRDIAARMDNNPDGISEEQILDMLNKMVRQRRDSIRLYEQGGRLELAEQEAAEISIIEEFLPEPMDEASLVEVVDAIIAKVAATSLRDMKRVMTALKDRHTGPIDIARASTLVKQRLD